MEYWLSTQVNDLSAALNPEHLEALGQLLSERFHSKKRYNVPKVKKKKKT